MLRAKDVLRLACRTRSSTECPPEFPAQKGLILTTRGRERGGVTGRDVLLVLLAATDTTG